MRVLSDEQKMLLRTLVGLAREERLAEVITLFPTGRPAEYAIHVRSAPSLFVRGTYHLDMLCEAGVLSSRWDRTGFNRIYRLIPASFDAVDGDFAGVTLPEESASGVDAQAIFHAMSGGRILPETLLRLPPFGRSKAHAADREMWIDALVGALLAEILPALPRTARVAYDRAARQAATDLKSQTADARRLRAELAELALLGNAELPLGLAKKAWPFVYLLTLLAR